MFATIATLLLLSPIALAQGSATNFGTSCGNSQLSFQGIASPGEAFTLTASNVQNSDVVTLIVGFDNTTSQFGALPLTLPNPQWSPGCVLYTSAEIRLPMINGVYSAILPPQLDNYHVYLQARIEDLSGVSSMTQAIDLFVISPLPGNGDVTGRTRFSTSGLPASNVRLTLFTPDLSEFYERRSDANGDYSFLGIPSGTYQLGSALRDWDYQQRTVIISSTPLVEDFDLLEESAVGFWSVIGSTAPQNLDASDIAVLRSDGSVFFCHDTTDSILFDPITGISTFPPSSSSEQGCMNGSLLADGSVFLAGGQDGSDPGSFRDAIPWAKKFRTDGTWQDLPDMLAPAGRWYPGLTRLADGRLLLFGGGTAPSAVRTNTSEIFDPATETWSTTGSMGSANEFAPSVLLHDGRVLRTWGTDPEVYDPSTGIWSATGGLTAPNRSFPGHSDHSIVQLTDGRAVILGINTLSQPGGPMSEFFDPSSNTWSAGSSPDLKRMQGEVVYLPDGRIFYGAGDIQNQVTAEPDLLGIVRRCDLFQPATGVWRQVADMLNYREYHAVTLLLPDARVITTGGTTIKFQTGPTTSDIDAWSPPYLSRGVRPSLSNASTTTPTRGTTLSADVFPQTSITSMVLMGLQTTTHWVDGGIPRRLELPVNQIGSQVSVTLPTDANLLPVGWYMMFAMVDDIPSDAIIVRVDP
ncbi:MAG: hypothetical protein COA70_09365 [Planctomycetota bacterium]|nr:MAG: hypothetical protein COA70_09365 [Planctomycetota bacterium]